LVVITITPLAPRAPYAAVADASFKTVILSIFALLILDKADKEDPALVAETLLLFIGTPSITYKGSFPAVMELTPLILISLAEPGVPELPLNTKPATLPCNTWSTLETGTCAIASALTCTVEPVISVFR